MSITKVERDNLKVTSNFTARVMQGAQLLKTAGLEDVASLLVRAELQDRKAARLPQGRSARRKRGVMVRLARNNRAVVLDADILNRVEVETC